nr:retrovirus-related Pol polyprotein from transposon TNT 1-94 [Tanacetum cinerariifolium]
MKSATMDDHVECRSQQQSYIPYREDRYIGRGCDRGQEAEQEQVKIMDKEVNQAARDSDDALVCCVENMVEDHIMDSSASFHATYCKEELERFKLRFGKDVRYTLGLKRRLISVGQLDEEVCHVGFKDQQWKVTKGSFPDVRKVDIYFCKPGGLGKQKNLSFIMSAKTRKLQRSCDRYNVNLQFGVAERLSRTLRAESTGLRAKVSKMLSADSVIMGPT